MPFFIAEIYPGKPAGKGNGIDVRNQNPGARMQKKFTKY